ncbi:MAG: hypothetical protein WC623_18620 [Pedobacter sp.]|uniref:hypothetical protein n=1 Tax=Pedobacter sp. TaxID=1411316 RepID=UPI0035691B24
MSWLRVENGKTHGKHALAMIKSLFKQILDETLRLPAATTAQMKEEMYQYIFDLTRPDYREGKRDLIKDGNVAVSIYFLLKGNCRFYYYSKSYKQELNPFLMLSPCILAEGRSMKKNCVARFSIEVSAGSVVYILDKAGLSAIESKYSEIGICINDLIKEQIQDFKLWKRRLKTRSPEHRYSKLKHGRPEVEQQSARKDIAGHLGIRNTSLSRMIRRLSK